MIRIGACEGPIADILERVEQSNTRDDVDPRLLSLCRLDGVDQQGVGCTYWAHVRRSALVSDRCCIDEPRARARGGGGCDAFQGSLNGAKLVDTICDKRIASSGAQPGLAKQSRGQVAMPDFKSRLRRLGERGKCGYSILVKYTARIILEETCREPHAAIQPHLP